ncbi:MAG TPA: hypothetical protein VHD56_13225 [Tepidisphaeraceae bacterium]|nr:hypothetical protein [Tepidisphaeraceae bacterium]
MTPRNLIQSITTLVVVLFSMQLLAQDAAEPVVENAKYQISGRINGNAVYVRSGASDNDYPTMQLNKGDEVTVVGEKFTWLKILPPEGSFCYAAKAFVNRAGNGSIGQVTTAVHVRAGSQLNLLTSKIVTTLQPNQRVEIVGEQDEYFKIKPPTDVYYYVNKQFVDPVRQLGAAPATAPSVPETAEVKMTQTPTEVAGNVGAAPSTQPTAQEAAAPAPSTQPVADAQSEFERLENLYSQSAQRPLDEQPIAELLAGYEQLAKGDALPESMRRIAEFKASALQSRAKMQAELQGHKQFVEDMKSKQLALSAEATELKERIEKAQVQFYTAIGTLRTSSLQYGQTPLYRLTDPANGRTVVYLRSDDSKLAQHMGEFLGVRGEITTDTQRNLTIITPTSFETIDPAKFGQTAAAQYAPPSLLPMASGTDSAGN